MLETCIRGREFFHRLEASFRNIDDAVHLLLRAYILGKSYAMSLLANLNARADQDAVRHPTDRATRISFNPQSSKLSSNGRSVGSVSFVRPFASNNEGRPESFLPKPIPLSVQESTLVGNTQFFHVRDMTRLFLARDKFKWLHLEGKCRGSGGRSSRELQC